MEVLLLGTGAGAGWPNPHCSCGSCRVGLLDGRLRGPTAALVDDRLLLDLGAEAGRAALRAGTDLSRVRAALVTHVHTDHFDPAQLYFRGLSSREPLTLVGPAPVVEEARRWLDPDGSPILLVEVTAGASLTVEGYAVVVLPANHEALGEAVLYDVTGPDGARVLYATDTGPWTAAALDLLAGRAYDLVLLEETDGHRSPRPGHHTLTTFVAAVARLHEVGAADAATDVVAVHLGHQNPVSDRLEQRLSEAGARTVADLTRLTVTRRAD